MENVLIKVKEHESLGKLEYYLNTTFHEEFPGVEMYGITIINNDEKACVENMDFERKRIIEFINCLADTYTTPIILQDLCENYVEMLTDRSQR